MAIAANRGQDVYVAGGADVYRQALEVADVMELTEVDASPEGDTWFPEVNWDSWVETGRIAHPGFDFVTYERV